MSRISLEDGPEQALRRLADQTLPTLPEDASPSRRDRIVRGMKAVVQSNAEQTERRRSVRRGLLVAAAAASILLLSGLLLRERFAASEPVAMAGVDSVVGTVVLTQQGVRHVVGAGERALRDGDALQTAAAARAHIETAKSSVNVGESTELKLSLPSAAEERISLRRGRVDVAVDKAVLPKRAVVVETPDAEVVVRGTVFDVRVEPSGGRTATYVHVTRGSVWVLSQGVQVALLAAGQSWSSVATHTTTGAQADAVAPTPAPEAAASEPPAAAARSASKDPSVSRKRGTLAEENRMFAAAIEARNRGEEGRAAELFGELLTTYPRSTLREAAQVERFRALNRAGQAARAASEARRYLAEHRDGSARGEARTLALDPQKQ